MSFSSQSPLHSQPAASPLKRKAMSITQTYYLAHTARGKLSHEAARSDHNLRYLVGHANLLDSLMLELAEAEQEQESWFNQSVRGATKAEEKHIQWADAVVEETEVDWQPEDAGSDSSDSDSEFDDDEEIESGFASLHRVSSYTAFPQSRSIEEDEEEYEDDGEEDYAMLTLSRTNSHPASPPDLSHDLEDSSEDESMPPSPPSDALPSFSQKQRQSSSPKLSNSEQAAFFDEGFYLPQRAAPTLVSAISVY